MAFNFPENPAAGTEHTEFGVDYVWDGKTWDLASGGEMTDYVLKVGDTMTGPLTASAGVNFGSLAAATPNDHSKHLHMWTGGTNGGFGITVTSGRLNFNVDATSNSHYFRVANVDKFQVHNTGIHVMGTIGVDGHVEVNGGTLYIDRTASGYGDSPALQFRHGSTYTAQLFANVSNNSGYGNWGGLDLQVTHGSYGNQNVMDVPGAQGAAVANMCTINAPAFNVTSDARLKNVRPVTSDEVTRLFGALRPVHFDRLTVLGEGATPEVCERSAPEYGFVADDIARDGAELVATMNVNDADTLVYSLSQLLAITVAKVQQLEAEIAQLRAQPRGSR